MRATLIQILNEKYILFKLFLFHRGLQIKTYLQRILMCFNVPGNQLKHTDTRTGQQCLTWLYLPSLPCLHSHTRIWYAHTEYTHVRMHTQKTRTHRHTGEHTHSKHNERLRATLRSLFRISDFSISLIYIPSSQLPRSIQSAASSDHRQTHRETAHRAPSLWGHYPDGAATRHTNSAITTQRIQLHASTPPSPTMPVYCEVPGRDLK